MRTCTCRSSEMFLRKFLQEVGPVPRRFQSLLHFSSLFRVFVRIHTSSRATLLPCLRSSRRHHACWCSFSTHCHTFYISAYSTLLLQFGWARIEIRSRLQWAGCSVYIASPWYCPLLECSDRDWNLLTSIVYRRLNGRPSIGPPSSFARWYPVVLCVPYAAWPWCISHACRHRQTKTFRGSFGRSSPRLKFQTSSYSCEGQGTHAIDLGFPWKQECDLKNWVRSDQGYSQPPCLSQRQ